MQTRSFVLTFVAVFLAACGGDVEHAASAGGQGGGPAGSGGQGGKGGQGGQGGAAGGGQGGAAGGGGQGGAAGGGGQGDCMEPCAAGLTCCSGKCVNLKNDIFNCGACGVACEGPTPYCNQGFVCMKSPPCLPEVPPVCDPGGFCCDDVCCSAGQLCCLVEGPGPFGGSTCQDPVDGTCPVGCPACQ